MSRNTDLLSVDQLRLLLATSAFDTERKLTESKVCFERGADVRYQDKLIRLPEYL